MSHISLSPAQAERLEMLAEECAEVVQVVTKILRHGYQSWHPDDPERTPNRELLEKELEDVLAVVDAMQNKREVDINASSYHKYDRWLKKRKYTHHQE